MHKIYSQLSFVYFLAATLLLILIAFFILVMAVWEAILGARTGDPVAGALSAIGLLVIGFAVVETASFIAEEEILRKRELRSSTESRRSITKFITIIVIASSMETLVMIFSVNRIGLEYAVYPAVLFFVSMFALVALGSYQWLSSRIRPDEDSRAGAPAESVGVEPPDEKAPS